MSRRKSSFGRDIIPDPLYKSVELTKFINIIMRDGKRTVAERIVYDALSLATQRIDSRSKKDARDNEGANHDAAEHAGEDRSLARNLTVLSRALDNICPLVELKSRRVGGSTYQIPVEVNVERGRALARRWLLKAARGRNEKTMHLRLAAELIDAFDNRGAAIKLRDDNHRMAKANQAFAHFRW